MSKNLLLAVTKNNAFPNREDYDTIVGAVLDAKQLPMENCPVLFHSSGSARFSNGENVLRVLTDSFGKCNANIVNSLSVPVCITGQTTDGSMSVQMTLSESYSKLTITSVNNKNGRFPDDLFDIVWFGSSFDIILSGGNGQITWNISSSTGLRSIIMVPDLFLIMVRLNSPTPSSEKITLLTRKLSIALN